MQSIDELAKVITALPRAEQEALIDKIAQLNFQKGLMDLSDRYRARLAGEGRLDIPADAIWEELQHIRDEVAERARPD